MYLQTRLVNPNYKSPLEYTLNTVRAKVHFVRTKNYIGKLPMETINYRQKAVSKGKNIPENKNRDTKGCCYIAMPAHLLAH